LLKRKTCGELHNAISITNHILGHTAIDFETTQASLFTKTNIVHSPTGDASVTLSLKQTCSYTLPNVESSLTLYPGTNCYDGSDRLVRRGYWTWRFINALPNLIVGMAEASSSYLEKDIVLSNIWDWNRL
jgi:hypothetical protein